MNKERVKQIEKEIRETWFKDHKAKYEKINDNLSILEWRRPGSSFYYCRFVFDGAKIYISGDIGEAIFTLTEKASLKNLVGYNIHYLHSKIRAFSDDRYSFDSDVANKRIDEEIKELREKLNEVSNEESSNNSISTGICDKEYTESKLLSLIETFETLREESDRCSSKGQWEYKVNEHYEDLETYDCDIHEWIFDIGDVIPDRVHGYLVGLQMAYEQLKDKGDVE